MENFGQSASVLRKFEVKQPSTSAEDFLAGLDRQLKALGWHSEGGIRRQTVVPAASYVRSAGQWDASLYASLHEADSKVDWIEISYQFDVHRR